jgi:hypothetical protein
MALKDKIQAGINLYVKLCGLLVVGLILFCPLIPFLSATNVMVCIYVSLTLAIFLILSHGLVVGYKELALGLRLWPIGVVFYALVCFLLIRSHASLAPGVNFASDADRWIYSLTFPVRVLGAVSAGFIFCSVTSPTEFLRWGKLGLAIAFLMRGIELTRQNILETQEALEMQGEWPSGGGFFSPRSAILATRNSILLVSTTLRNVILWAPWAWLCYNKIATSFKGDS